MSDNIQSIELSSEELDLVAGGARRVAFGETAELTDVQFSSLSATRDGVESKNFQATDDFSARIFEVTETGK